MEMAGKISSRKGMGVIMEKQTIRIRRVGSVTFGMILIVTGVLFLVHLFLPRLDYRMIFRFWPIILITLGVEVLLGSRQKTYEVWNEKGQILEQSKVVYDVPAILLTMVLTGFSMFMGMIDWAIMHSQNFYF